MDREPLAFLAEFESVAPEHLVEHLPSEVFALKGCHNGHARFTTNEAEEALLIGVTLHVARSGRLLSFGVWRLAAPVNDCHAIALEHGIRPAVVLPSVAQLELPHRTVEFEEITFWVHGNEGVRIHAIDRHVQMDVRGITMDREHVLMIRHSDGGHGMGSTGEGFVVGRAFASGPGQHNVIDRITNAWVLSRNSRHLGTGRRERKAVVLARNTRRR